MRLQGNLRADLRKESESGRGGGNHGEQEGGGGGHGEYRIKQEKERDCENKRTREVFSFYDRQVRGDFSCLPVHDSVGDAVFVPVGQEPDRKHGAGRFGTAVPQDTLRVTGSHCPSAGKDLGLCPVNDVFSNERKRIAFISVRRYIRRIRIKTAEEGWRKVLCPVCVKGGDGLTQAVIQRGRRIEGDTIIGGVHIAVKGIMLCDNIIPMPRGS